MSPDLNPIENVWRQLKIAVQARKPTSAAHGWEIIQEEWPKISQKYYETLVHSMGRRLQAVLEANGGATKY